MTAEQIDNGELLMDACNQVIHDLDLAPEKDPVTDKIVKTHCNAGALLVAQAMGCHEFDAAEGADPLLADELVWVMRTNASGKWTKVTGSEATIHALGGGLGFAAMTAAELGEAHGHIAAIYPVGMQMSGSLKKDVPMVANVGMDQGEEKVSKAFPVSKGEPDYFIWTA